MTPWPVPIAFVLGAGAAEGLETLREFGLELDAVPSRNSATMARVDALCAPPDGARCSRLRGHSG
jgi:hypothetical protein